MAAPVTTSCAWRRTRSLGATATHYQALQVAPDATADEVRQAYLRLALLHHPDRLDAASPEERRAADARMVEVNAAWAVLGEEGRRVRYDQELLAAGAASTPEDPFAHLVRRQRPVRDVE
ncbi:hypothetical protein B7486_74420, partial [cyanobacterium TDX16]